MKIWQKIIATIAIVAAFVATGYTVLVGYGEGHKGSAKNITLGLDLNGGVSVTYQAIGDVSSQDMDDVVYKMAQRIEMYDGASAYKEGFNRVTVEIPGATDAQKVLEELGKPGALYFILEYAKDGKTPNYKVDYKIQPDGTFKQTYVLNRKIEEMKADGTLVLTGEDVKSAEGTEYQEVGPVVEFALTKEGAAKFKEATTLAKDKKWTIGVYYDGEFISVPSVSAVISDGQGYIEGMGTVDAAKKLASNIRIGALPVELEEITSQVVGATLGQSAISTSVKAGIIGFIILFIFMLVYYRVPGIAANLALVAYTGGMLALLNVFDLTLTLPGIAGIVLGIGMAVDANVIIFSRIREEIGRGLTVRNAIDIGFKKAVSAIIDGNVTTLIAAVILGIIGSGPVKGFAVTLGLGILLSMFTSLIVSRLILLLLYNLGFNKASMYGKEKERKAVDFLSKRKLFISIAGLVIATGIAVTVVNGVRGKGAFNFDLEFSGGTTTTVAFNEEYTLEEAEDKIIPLIKDKVGVSTVQQQAVKGSNTIIFKTKWLSEEQQKAFNELLKNEFKLDVTDPDVVSYERISATISGEMRRDAVIAVIVATICMLIYIWIRFRDVKFATSAILALLHDVLIVLAFYAISRTTVGNTFIACMLTIVGYSINATIVIFDRIRENLKAMGKSTLTDVVNSSITSTLTRSINTSLTTFVMVFVLYIMGVASIKEFAAPIMVGIVAGAYSSICITGALWFIMKKASYKRAMKKAE
jgi:SecD/SecF fusion protein